jgi:hypothetical protein
MAVMGAVPLGSLAWLRWPENIGAECALILDDLSGAGQHRRSAVR